MDFDSPIRVILSQYESRVHTLLKEATGPADIRKGISSLYDDCVALAGAGEAPGEFKGIDLFQTALNLALADIKAKEFPLYYLFLYSLYEGNIAHVAKVDEAIEQVNARARAQAHGGYIGVDADRTIRCYTSSPDPGHLLSMLEYNQVPLRVYRLLEVDIQKA